MRRWKFNEVRCIFIFMSNKKFEDFHDQINEIKPFHEWSPYDIFCISFCILMWFVFNFLYGLIVFVIIIFIIHGINLFLGFFISGFIFEVEFLEIFMDKKGFILLTLLGWFVKFCINKIFP